MDNFNINAFPAMDQPGTPASQPATPPVVDPNAHARFLENLVQQLLNERARGEAPREREGRARVQLPVFHGYTHENVSSWILQMEMGFQADNVMSDDRRIAAAATCLREAAFEWFRSTNNEEAFVAWDEFKEKVRHAFLPPNDQHLFRRSLKMCKQTSTVQDYVYRFRSIMGQIEDMAELDKIDHFISGLRPMTAAEVNYQCPQTLSSAIEIATMYDSARFPSDNRPAGLVRIREQPRVVREQPRPVPFQRPLHHQQRRPGTPMELDNVGIPNRRNLDRKRKLCFLCHLPGHFARNCPNRNGGQPGNG